MNDQNEEKAAILSSLLAGLPPYVAELVTRLIETDLGAIAGGALSELADLVRSRRASGEPCYWLQRIELPAVGGAELERPPGRGWTLVRLLFDGQFALYTRPEAMRDRESRARDVLRVLHDLGKESEGLQ